MLQRCDWQPWVHLTGGGKEKGGKEKGGKDGSSNEMREQRGNSCRAVLYIGQREREGEVGRETEKEKGR